MLFVNPKCELASCVQSQVLKFRTGCQGANLHHCYLSFAADKSLRHICLPLLIAGSVLGLLQLTQSCVAQVVCIALCVSLTAVYEFAAAEPTVAICCNNTQTAMHAACTADTCILYCQSACLIGWMHLLDCNMVDCDQQWSGMKLRAVGKMADHCCSANGRPTVLETHFCQGVMVIYWGFLQARTCCCWPANFPTYHYPY